MNYKLFNKLLNIILILFLSITFAGCNLHKKSSGQESEYKTIILNEKQEQNAGIKTEILKNQMIQLTISIPAQFKPVNKFLDRIYTPINGIAEKVFVQIGDIVKIGQPLVLIKSDDIGQIQLDFLSAYIDTDSNIKQMTAQYNLSVQTYKREYILYKEGISSRAEYEVARAQMLKDKANLDSLKIKKNALIKVYAQRVALYGGNESTIMRAASTKRIYPYITLCSHKHGIILERKVNPGEIIELNKELFNLADLSTVWLVGYAFEKDVPYLKVGQNVVGVFEERQEKSVKGTLSFVASVVDKDKRTLEVIADIPNKNFAIKPNTYAEMIVNTDKVNALAAPNTALQKYGDYTFAYVKIAPHTYEERKVKLGQSNDKFTEIKSGVNFGEEIVSNGSFSLLGESIKMKEE